MGTPWARNGHKRALCPRIQPRVPDEELACPSDCLSPEGTMNLVVAFCAPSLAYARAEEIGQLLRG